MMIKQEPVHEDSSAMPVWRVHHVPPPPLPPPPSTPFPLWQQQLQQQPLQLSRTLQTTTYWEDDNKNMNIKKETCSQTPVPWVLETTGMEYDFNNDGLTNLCSLSAVKKEPLWRTLIEEKFMRESAAHRGLLYFIFLHG